MIRLIFTALMFTAQAHASGFSDLFGDPAWASPPEAPVMCKYTFDRGRNTVQITHLDTGEFSSCTFTRSETIPAPGGGWFGSTTYIYYYTCNDGTTARYTTNWMGSTADFRYSPGGEMPSVKCE